MQGWLGIGLIALGLGLVGAGVLKRRNRMRTVLAAGAIRPEFAAMGQMIRPLVLIAVGIIALNLTAFYFVFGGQKYLTPFAFAAVLFVLASYTFYLVMATTRSTVAVAAEPVATEIRSAA